MFYYIYITRPNFHTSRKNIFLIYLFIFINFYKDVNEFQMDLMMTFD